MIAAFAFSLGVVWLAASWVAVGFYRLTQR